MKIVYVANYHTQEDLNCDLDDNPARNTSLSDYSAPQVSRVFAKWDSNALKMCQRDVQNEIDELFEGCEQDGDTQPKLRWVEGEFETPVHGYENATHFAYNEADDTDLMAAIVVQKRPLE